MLGLKLPTDPRWVNIAEKNIQEIESRSRAWEKNKEDKVISLGEEIVALETIDIDKVYFYY